MGGSVERSMAAQLVQAAEVIWPKFQLLLDSPNYRGLILLVQEVGSAGPSDPVQVPVVIDPPLFHVSRPAEHLADLAKIGTEKIRRMIETESGSSWAGRNPTKTQLGGAIQAGQWYIAPCGLTEYGDEAFALAIAIQSGLMTQADAESFAAASGNTLFNTFIKQ